MPDLDSQTLRRGALHRALLQLDPETAHGLAIHGLQCAGAVPGALVPIRRRFSVLEPRLKQRVWGATFDNPVGLAAGFDKDARAMGGLAALGFGFLEVGTVTPMPQRGNPRPRLFRHPDQVSLQNCLGFNNRGMKAMRTRLEQQGPPAVPVGVNIGKNKATPIDRALEDYETLVRTFDSLCDYLVINISSPNTPGLRGLQQSATVRSLVERCGELTTTPLVVKLAPDMPDKELIELSVTAVEAGASGVMVTNTTTEYSLIPGIASVGGLSGGVLKARSRQVLQVVAKELFGRCVLISVGGIDSAQEAFERLKWGASLVQIYTAMVYSGPGLVGRIVAGIAQRMEVEGYESLSQVIGANL